ncbi:MAG: DUF4954 family protein [Treponemataceae bacterium]
MKEVRVVSSDRYGYDFIPAEYLPPGTNEYRLRDSQADAARRKWRRLHADEIEVLIKNDNSCTNWDDFLVSDPFDPSLVRNSSFYGLVRLGKLENVQLMHHDFRVSAGIRNSTIISCDIGDNCAIQDCAYISHYVLGDTVILSRIDEMQTTNHAKFGNGILKDGESEDLRVWIDVMNEAGGRSVLPFAGMICADAFLWAAYRDDAKLIHALMTITQRKFGSDRGVYGVIGSSTVIKSCRILKDVLVGECAYIKGANKLKNITVESSEAEPTQIGEGVELVNGIVGYGCRVFYGAKAVRFVIGRNASLKYGARLIHSVLGDNSTVSCCEMLNNLIFPAHEQHHNNSFLIASLVQGQSNMAAGATVGSNHNSRANDGEIRAGRGFWPGLCVTLKHSSRFASYVLIAKGDYSAELDIPFPFSLVNNDVSGDRLEIMPAYYWLYNLYALERNAWKIAARDKRLVKVQLIETHYLAPDTAEEILRVLPLLERWTAEAHVRAAGGDPQKQTSAELEAMGKELLTEKNDRVAVLKVFGLGMEHSSRPNLILKPRVAYRAYRRMLRWYAVRGLMAFLETRPLAKFQEVAVELNGPRIADWVNLGGQIVPANKVDLLRSRIGDGAIRSWDEIHAAYGDFAREYSLDVARHSWAVLAELRASEGKARETPLGPDEFLLELETASSTRAYITEQVRMTRSKDYRDPFRRMTYRNSAEIEAVLGTPESNPFIKNAEEDEKEFAVRIERLGTRLREE